MTNKGILTSSPNRIASPGRTFQEWQNTTGFAALRDDGSVVTWGKFDRENSPYYLRKRYIEYKNLYSEKEILHPLDSDVVQIFSNQIAFAALKKDGSVFSWGQKDGVGEWKSNTSIDDPTWYVLSDDINLSNITKISSTQRAFAGVKEDGSIICWGTGSYGGSTPNIVGKVSDIYSNGYAFAAIREDGSVVTWGNSGYGGDSSKVSDQLSSDVIRIYSTHKSFAALKSDGSVVTWGDDLSGGDSSNVAEFLSGGVSEIYATDDAFAAINNEGSATSWGGNGLSDDLQTRLNGISKISTSSGAFAALTKYGYVINWGHEKYGNVFNGVLDLFSSHYKYDWNDFLGEVVDIYAHIKGFAALTSEGAVYTWGRDDIQITGVDPENFQNANSRQNIDVEFNDNTLKKVVERDVVKIIPGYDSFVAVKEDGSLVDWGDKPTRLLNKEELADLTSEIIDVFSIGISESNKSQLARDLPQNNPGYYGNYYSGTDSETGYFIALKKDGHLVAFGDNSYLSYNSGSPQLIARNSDISSDYGYFSNSQDEVSKTLDNVVGFADPYSDDWLNFIPETFSTPDSNNITTNTFEINTTNPAGLYQQVATLTPEINYIDGQQINIPVIYNSSDASTKLTGISFNLHYDSSFLNPVDETDAIKNNIDADIFTHIIKEDINNLDNNDSTDKILEMIWASFAGEFPDQSVPVEIANINFQTNSSDIDSITGEIESSTIAFTSSEAATGYQFLKSTTSLIPQNFNLDVDGDGSVTALGDGLMIIRKLFGDAFAGTKLTNKAISTDATRTTDEIHEFIQGGIDSGVLDVDSNGKVSALGDGLMVIRKLFGAAFSGEALTSKALDTQFSAYANQSEPWKAVSSNIDVLMLPSESVF